MEPKPNTESSRSPAPGVIPEPTTVQTDPAPADHHRTAAPEQGATTEAASPPRRNPAGAMLAKALSALRRRTKGR